MINKLTFEYDENVKTEKQPCPNCGVNPSVDCCLGRYDYYLIVKHRKNLFCQECKDKLKELYD